MKQAILKTLCYADIFSYPLTSKEVHKFLIGKKSNHSQVEDILNSLKIKKSGKYYYLSKTINISKREQRQVFATKKYKIAKKLSNLLKIFSSIQAVYVTGALAVENASEKDDIDFLIITKPHTLWITRFFTNLLFDGFRLRRKPLDKNINNKACLNLWLTTDNLSVSKNHRTLYQAHEVAQAQLLWERNQAGNKFLSDNRWIEKFLPNTSIPTYDVHKIQSIIPKNIEKIFFIIQKLIMSSKKTTEKITLQSAFFHPRDTQKQVGREYNKRLKKYL